MTYSLLGHGPCTICRICGPLRPSWAWRSSSTMTASSPNSVILCHASATCAAGALALGVLEAADRTEADGCPAACDSAESAATTTRDLLSPVLAAGTPGWIYDCGE